MKFNHHMTTERDKNIAFLHHDLKKYKPVKKTYKAIKLSILQRFLSSLSAVFRWPTPLYFSLDLHLSLNHSPIPLLGNTIDNELYLTLNSVYMAKDVILNYSVYYSVKSAQEPHNGSSDNWTISDNYTASDTIGPIHPLPKDNIGPFHLSKTWNPDSS